MPLTTAAVKRKYPIMCDQSCAGQYALSPTNHPLVKVTNQELLLLLSDSYDLELYIYMINGVVLYHGVFTVMNLKICKEKLKDRFWLQQ